MEMKTGQLNLSRLLPKTGQTGVISAGDDGTHQAGWWKGKKQADNKTRFVVKDIAGDDVVIDRATGLMWPKDCTGDGGYLGQGKLWLTHLNWANGLTLSGYSDWRMPNVFEFFTLMQFKAGAGGWPLVFINTIANYYWTSTLSKQASDDRYAVNTGNGLVSALQYDMEEKYLLCVRGGL